MSLLAVAGIVVLTLAAGGAVLWAVSEFGWWHDAAFFKGFRDAFDLRDAYDAAAEAARGSRVDPIGIQSALCPRCQSLHAIDVGRDRRPDPITYLSADLFDERLRDALRLACTDSVFSDDRRSG